MSNPVETSIDPLYCKVQKFLHKTGRSDECQRNLQILVDLKSSLTKVSNKFLYVQITDEEDPYLLYSLVITESDYQQLKTSQGLLVDFYNFPAEVVRLLNECSFNGEGGCRFLPVLEEEKKNDMDSGRAFLKIIEINNFKHLCHLQLQLSPGSDADLKKLLLSKIKGLKDQLNNSDRNIFNLNSQLIELSSQLQIKSKEIMEIQQKWNEDKLSYKVECSREISEETDKLRRAHTEWQLKMQRERTEMEDKFLNSIREKESELAKLRTECKLHIEKKNTYETTVRDQLKRIDSLEKELTSAQWELSAMRKQSSKLDSDYHEKEKMVHSLKTKVAVLEQELKDKSLMLNKMQEAINSGDEQRKHLEEVLAESEKNVQRKSMACQSLSQQVMKGNEIIAKFQDELAVAATKLKVRNGIVLEQEKVIERNKVETAELKIQLEEKDKKLKIIGESEAVLKKTIEELKELIASKDKTIKDNEKIIDWLNRRLSDQSQECISPSWANPSAPFSTGKSSSGSPEMTHSTPCDKPAKPLLRTKSKTVTPPLKPDKPDKVKPDKPAQKPSFKRVSISNNVSTIPSSYFSK